MILIYTHKITPRVKYIFKHIFARILLLPVDFTTKIEAFVAHNGPKLSYTNAALGTEFFIKSHELLFQQGTQDVDIEVEKWDGLPCFFLTSIKSSIPFDIFAASFYLISRYEEYLPHVKDMHGRYTPEQSIAFKNNFLEQPVIDFWAYKFLKKLQDRFPDYSYKKRQYTYTSTLDIDNAYAYKHKNLLRSVGGLFKDLFSLKVLSVFNRLAVTLAIRKDPFDTFDILLKIKKKYNVQTVFFFLIGDYTTYDTNVSASKNRYKLLIKEMVDYAKVGLHPSYFSMNNSELLKKEKKRLEAITNTPIEKSRQHYLRFNLPETYQHLIDTEIHEDFSMGYATRVGFRASTCSPFYFYDINFEIQTPLKVFPFALMDTTLNDFMKLTPKQSIGKIRDLKNIVKAVDGHFITLFHNESLSNYGRWKGWGRLYETMIKIATS